MLKRLVIIAALLLATTPAIAGRGFNPNWRRPGGFDGFGGGNFGIPYRQNYFYYGGVAPWGTVYGGGFASGYGPAPMFVAPVYTAPVYPVYPTWGWGYGW